ncbi:MAG: hypothetical protein R3245_12120, partial [Kiloniellales bacterium]|nr:hypothetical protein [Kiloniellales bacterium]
MLEKRSNSQNVLEALSGGQTEIGGFQGSSCAYLLSHWFRVKAFPLLVIVTATTKQMFDFAEELSFYHGEESVYRFPPYDTLPYFQISPHRDVLAQRMKAINGLLYDPRPKYLLTSIAGLASPVVAKSRLQNKRQVLKPGDTCDRDILASLAADWGYQKTPLVEDRGTFAVRGGIVDIWGPLDSMPWRIELLGDEIESIRRFHPQSQKSSETLTEVWMVPVKELLWDEGTRLELADAFVRAADEVGLKATEKRQAAERLREGLLFGGAEHLLPLLAPPAHITDYFPKETQCVLWNESEIREHLDDLHNEIVTARETTESVERVLEPETCLNQHILDDTSWQHRPLRRMTAELREGTLGVTTESNEDVRWMIRKQTEAPLSELAKRISRWQEENRVVLVASSVAQRRRLLDLFEPYSLPLEAQEGDLAETLKQDPS